VKLDRTRLLRRNVEEIFKRMDDAKAQYRAECSAAYDKHLSDHGVTVHIDRACRYWRDGKPLWDHEMRALGSYPVPEQPQPFTDADRAWFRELDIAEIEEQGNTREDAERILAEHEATVAARSAEIEAHHWPRYRFEVCGHDSATHQDRFILTNEET
jgi:hypothetical protein